MWVMLEIVEESIGIRLVGEGHNSRRRVKEFLAAPEEQIFDRLGAHRYHPLCQIGLTEPSFTGDDPPEPTCKLQIRLCGVVVRCNELADILRRKLLEDAQENRMCSSHNPIVVYVTWKTLFLTWYMTFFKCLKSFRSSNGIMIPRRFMSS